MHNFSIDLYNALFPRSSFSHLNLKHILEDISRDPLISAELSIPTTPFSPPVSSVPHTPHTTTTSSHIPSSLLEIPPLSTIPSSQIKTPIPTSFTSLIYVFPTSPLDISPIIVQISVSQSQPEPSTTPQKETLSPSEEITDFGEDVVVSLGKYFWSKKDKAILKKESKRTREGTLKHVSGNNQVVWITNAPNEKQGALDTKTAMGAFVGDNYDSVSQLTKDILSKEQELQKYKRDL